MEAANAQLTAFQDSLTGGKEEKDMLMEEITQKKIALSSIGQNVYSMEEKLLRLQEEQKALRTEQKKAEEQAALYEKIRVCGWSSRKPCSRGRRSWSSRRRPCKAD